MSNCGCRPRCCLWLFCIDATATPGGRRKISPTRHFPFPADPFPTIQRPPFTIQCPHRHPPPSSRSAGTQPKAQCLAQPQFRRLRRGCCHFYDVLLATKRQQKSLGFLGPGFWTVGPVLGFWFLAVGCRLSAFGFQCFFSRCYGCSRSTVPSMQSYKIKTYFKSFSGTFRTAYPDPLSLARRSHPFYYYSAGFCSGFPILGWLFLIFISGTLF